MTAQKTAKPPIPRWAWAFAVACFVIPVLTVGGAIPSAIGAFSGLGVIAVARQQGQPIRRRVVLCGVITGSAWTVFVVFLLAWTALQNQHPSLRTGRARSASPSTVSELGDAAGTVATAAPLDRRKIYRKAVRMRFHIDSAREQRAKLRDKGFDVSARDEQIDRLLQREQDHLDFVARFHKITRVQVDEIVTEGDRNHWPTD
jgi:hypothetical protein